MTPAELIPIIRSEYIDEILDEEECNEDLQEEAVKNKTAFLLRELNRAQRQACWRGDMRKIHGAGTTTMDTITLVADQRSYALDVRILLIDSGVFDGVPMRKSSERLLDEWNRGCNWRNRTAGCPTSYYIKGRTLYFDRTPDQANAGKELVLDIWRIPLRDARMRDQLEIEDDPESLGHWVAHKALLRPNYDKGDPALAQYHLAEFNNYYGMPVSQQSRLELLAAPPAVNFGRADLIRWPVLDDYDGGSYGLFGNCGDY